MKDEFNKTAEAVTLVSEDETEERFLHILTFPYEGEKYAALVPEAQTEAENPEVLFVRIVRDKKGDAYIPVENEVLLEELFTEFASLIDEIDGGEQGNL